MVVPGSERGGRNRGRLESYASGASAPNNTSSGNISWTGSDKTGSGDRTPTEKSRNRGKSPKENPRMLIKSHPDPAIDIQMNSNDVYSIVVRSST